MTPRIDKLVRSRRLRGAPPAASTAVPMPTTEPAGFTRVYANDFLTPAALGTFVPDGSSRLPVGHPYYDSMKCYIDNNGNSGYAGDLGNGRYYSSKVFSARTDVAGANGVLDEWLHLEDVGDGVQRFLSGWWIPYIAGRSQYWLYGRFSIRIRADAIAGAGGVHLLIPDSVTPGSGPWPQNGELDWPEGKFATVPVGGFNHYADPAANSSNYGSYQKYIAGIAGSKWQDWHTYTIEWTPGVGGVPRQRWLMDDVVCLDTTDRVPGVLQKYVPFQCGINGSTIPPAGSQGHVQIDWVTVADYTG